jgi:hypothetical protein
MTSGEFVQWLKGALDTYETCGGKDSVNTGYFIDSIIEKVKEVKEADFPKLDKWPHHTYPPYNPFPNPEPTKIYPFPPWVQPSSPWTDKEDFTPKCNDAPNTQPIAEVTMQDRSLKVTREPE